MRKILLIFCVIAITCPLAGQNNKKHELSIGLGISGGKMPDKVLKDVITGMLNIENRFSTDDKKRSGFYLSYKYHLNERWSAGTTLTYKHLTQKRSSNTIEARYIQNFYGINLECQYTYLSRRIFRMYVLGGAGIYTCKESLRRTENTKPAHSSEQTTDFTYQISPLCFEIGTNIGLKMEYGYGYKGIGSLGAYIRF